MGQHGLVNSTLRCRWDCKWDLVIWRFGLDTLKVALITQVCNAIDISENRGVKHIVFNNMIVD